MRAQGLHFKTLFLITMPVKTAVKRELIEVRNTCWEEGRENRKQREREKGRKINKQDGFRSYDFFLRE